MPSLQRIKLFSTQRERRHMTRKIVFLGSVQEVELLLNEIQRHNMSEGGSMVVILSSNIVCFSRAVMVDATLSLNTHCHSAGINDI